MNKLITVSTRLPVTVSKNNGKIELTPSSGGLATGVAKVSETRDGVWIGWPGISSDELTDSDKKTIVKELKKYKCHPIFLNQQEVDEFYSGYCNATIWPLFHYFTNMVEYSSEFWESYKKVNNKFASEVSKFVDDNSQVWVHDYQLMLVPAMIRNSHPNSQIGFFLHTPFPSFEIFRLLPERGEILEGLLGANLVGFHTYDYVRHFLSSVKRHLGYEIHLSSIDIGSRVVLADAFPISIDYEKFSKSPTKLKAKNIFNEFDFLKKHKVILSVDRADYSKGIPARLDAFERFLRNNPKYIGKVVFILLAVPSRTDVGAYQDLRDKIEQKVGRINGQYSTVDWSPISYLYQSMPFDELKSLYSRADVMLVTPLRDGMNLVAKEYIATHHKKGGVLILSEMAGAASELQEAIQVNPNDYQMVANALKQAITMPIKEQKTRMKAMQSRIETYDINKWAEDFIVKLESTKLHAVNEPKSISKKEISKIVKDYEKSSNRLILLDYDGTLKSFVNSPKKSLAYPTPRVRKVIKKLTSDKKNQIIVVSGRPKSSLNAFFEERGLGLVAEHGGWVLDAGSWVKRNLKPKKWKKPIKEMLNQYSERTPGAVVEEKDFSVVWHYRNVSPDLAYVRNEEIKMNLRDLLNEYDVDIFEGAKVLEVKPANMHKGAIVSELLSQKKWDYILCIGDDYTDEDMFRALPDYAYTIHVGNQDTRARYKIGGVKEVVSLLEQLQK